MAFRFRHMRVKTRIYLGFGLLIVIATGVAIFGINRLSSVQAQVGVMNSASESATRMLNTAVQLEASRRSILRYRFYMDADSLTGIKDSISKAADLLSQASAEPASPDQLRTLASLQNDLRTYSGLADKAVALQNETCLRTFLSRNSLAQSANV